MQVFSTCYLYVFSKPFHLVRKSSVIFDDLGNYIVKVVKLILFKCKTILKFRCFMKNELII